MILATLTPKQTAIWIKNLNKLLTLRTAVKKYHNSVYDNRETQYNERYGFFGKLWHGGAAFEDLRIGWDGYYHESYAIFGKIGKVDPIPDKLCYYMRVTRFVYRDKRDAVLQRLKDKWERYASQPFQIQEGDLEMYQNLFVWHEELKEILVEGGVYDETLNLDEDR
jgi:hypothetical protein